MSDRLATLARFFARVFVDLFATYGSEVLWQGMNADERGSIIAAFAPAELAEAFES